MLDQKRKPDRSASQRAALEDGILRAAEVEFADRGFEGATTSAIAARAGLPKANLHYYFPTKEALYRRVIDSVLTAWLDAAAVFDREGSRGPRCAATSRPRWTSPASARSARASSPAR